jgi:hypothetical protein
MTLTPLAVTAITNFILACVVFLVAGMLLALPKERGSAAWFWSLVLLLLGASALLGGIDHGFFEVHGQLPIRRVIERSNWVLLGTLTAAVLATTARQFFSPTIQRVLFVVAAVQFVVYVLLVVTVANFLVVILNYAPAILLLLAASVAGLRGGTGSWTMVAGLVVMLLASVVQAAQIDVFSPVDRNGLYHLIALPGVILLYLGGRTLKRAV